MGYGNYVCIKQKPWNDMSQWVNFAQKIKEWAKIPPSDDMILFCVFCTLSKIFCSKSLKFLKRIWTLMVHLST